MLRTKQCENKFKEIKAEIDYLPETRDAELYIEHLQRLREAYSKEFLKALEREAEK